MKEILEQILKSEQVNNLCILLPDGQWLCGKIQSMNKDLLWLKSCTNNKTDRYWTVITKIDVINAIEYRSDIRPLTNLEKESADSF